MIRSTLCLLVLATLAPAQGGSYGNLTWVGDASIIVRNGRPLFVLVGSGNADNVLSWYGSPVVELRAVEAAVLDNRSCLAGTRLYLHETDALDSSYEAVFGPLSGSGFDWMSGGSPWFPPRMGNLWEYTLTYCTVWDPANMTYQGPCGEGPTCGNTQPQVWGVIFEVR